MKRKTYSEEINFVTLTVVGWVDVFTQRRYNDFVIDCLRHCRKEKGVEIYAYVLMTNHLHLVVRVSNGNLSGILRDFKTYTSKELVKMIQGCPDESRKKWMLNIFAQYGKQNAMNLHHQFWQNGNYPVALYSNEVLQQKIDYVHQNPVKAGFVDQPHKYYYSSANPDGPLEIDG